MLRMYVTMNRLENYQQRGGDDRPFLIHIFKGESCGSKREIRA